MRRKRHTSQKKQGILRKGSAFLSLGVTLMLAGIIAYIYIPTVRDKILHTNISMVQWTKQQAISTAKRFGFVINNIHVSGLKYTPKLDVLKAIDINYGDCIFTVDTQKLLLSLKTMGWIEHVVIQTKLPGTIDITIQEYEPYALWQYRNHISVITETGVVIPKASPKQFADLPLVVGEKANLFFKNLLSILTDYPELKELMLSAQYMHGRRWRLYVSSGVVVELPEENLADSIHRLYDLHHQQKILDRDVEIIDIRVPNKLIFKDSKTIKKTKKLTQQGV